MDLRYKLIRERLSSLTKTELQKIIDNIDDVCLDEYNFDSENNKYCPLAMAMNLETISNPTDEKIKAEIGKRFQPVNIIKGVVGNFYTNNRKENLINLCKELIDEIDRHQVP